MTDKEIRDLLEKQLRLLSEQSEKADTHALSEASLVMASICRDIRQYDLEERQGRNRPPVDMSPLLECLGLTMQGRHDE